MKHSSFKILPIIAVCGLALSSYGTDVVRDTWLDGTRTDPASPTYSENGVDGDADLNLESAWFGTSLTVPAAGTLRGTVGSGSSFWTTYFTPTASPITLANAGDTLRVTWVFTPTTVNTNNTSQGFPLALANSQSATRLSADGSPASSVYSGYAMFMNMGNTLGNGNPFALKEWVLGATPGNLLGTSANWGANGASGGTLANGATSGNHGYDSGITYTLVMELIRNGGGGLDITSTMTGGTLNGTGTATVSITDATPNTFTFDTFSIRPSGSASGAQLIDSSLFKVEFVGVPEPSMLALGGFGVLCFAMKLRRGRK